MCHMPKEDSPWHNNLSLQTTVVQRTRVERKTQLYIRLQDFGASKIERSKYSGEVAQNLNVII